MSGSVVQTRRCIRRRPPMPEVNIRLIFRHTSRPARGPPPATRSHSRRITRSIVSCRIFRSRVSVSASATATASVAVAVSVRVRDCDSYTAIPTRIDGRAPFSTLDSPINPSVDHRPHSRILTRICAPFDRRAERAAMRPQPAFYFYSLLILITGK